MLAVHCSLSAFVYFIGTVTCQYWEPPGPLGPQWLCKEVWLALVMAMMLVAPVLATGKGAGAMTDINM